ncbi:MAG: xanthine dehydrogenase family protein molybdopterin-binding subunit [Burkholderiaceae bacterium]
MTTTFSRHEDRRLVTGAGHFTADWNLPDQLHAAIVRSDRAHARIVGLDLQAARDADGVVAVLTADDVAQAGFAALPSGGPLKGVGDQPQHKAPMPLLATDRVRFVGQPVAMVVAETATAARDAAELVAIDYEELPAVVGVEAALAAGAPLLHENAPGNLSVEFERGDRAAVDAAFANAAMTSTIRIASQRLAGAPMELRACLAHHDPASNRTRIYTPTQGILGMRASLTAVTNWPDGEIEVIAQDVGGSFGLRGGTYSEQPLCMLAARKLGRPVKWQASRSELFIGEFHGRALTLTGSVAMDADGNFLAFRFEDEADLGAYTCYWGSFIGTNNLSVTMGGVYRVPALYMHSRLAFTNTVPVSAYRGAGRPDIAFAIERMVDHAAAEHGLDPAELRRRNFVPPDAFPYRTANGTVYDCGDFEGVMDKALALSGYAGFPARRQASEAAGRLRGIGFGCYLEASGAGGAPKDEVSCRFGADGRLTLFGVTGPSGQGHETSFAQIVAGGLGIDMDSIDYRASDPALSLVGNGTGGSRSLYGAGSAFKNLVEQIIETARPHAATMLGADGALEFSGGVQERQRFDRPAGAGTQLAPSGEDAHPLDCSAHSISGSTFPNGCHVAELEIDPETGETRIEAYVSVDDLGNIISPTLVWGQVHGGVVQGAGQAFTEQIVYDPDTGQLLSGSFMDYAMPRAGILPQVRTDTHPVPTSLNALGSKGVGESGCSGSLPAISNAMMDALRTVGVGPIDMPYTPARVWAALRGARAGAGETR